jgi:Tol biopolymer transport system component
MKLLAILLAALMPTGLNEALAEDADVAPKIYATRADGSPAWELATLTEYPYANFPDLSPDGTYVALEGWREGESGNDAHILVFNLNDGTVQDLGPGAMPNWSADGAWIAYSNYAPDRGVYIRQFQGGAEELIEADGWGIQWSPDGNRLAYARGGNLIIYDAATGTKRAVFPENQPLRHEEIYGNCAWSLDSKRICFKARRRSIVAFKLNQHRDDELAVVMADGDPELKVCFTAADVAEDIVWHPDGARILIPMAGRLHEFDPDKLAPACALPGQPAGRTNTGMCWSRDGSMLLFISYRQRDRFGRLILDVF